MAQQILVVDDSDTVRDVVRSTLEHSGYGVIEAEDGYDALERLGRGAVDLVITDLTMPRMGGLELIKRMSENTVLSGVPIVVISANIDEKGINAAGNGCVVAWIEKPFRLKMLIQKVREGLERVKEDCLEGV